MPKKILLVEDELDTVEIVKKRLVADGHAVLTAADGLEALQMARSEKPDLIILDLMLPKFDGYKVCRMLKFDENYKNIPIIMCTARAMKSDEELGLQVGTDAYITKPFQLQTLIDEVNKLLAKSS